MSKKMFDYVCMNPPYQITKGGTKNIDIWPSFIEAAVEVADYVSVVHPGRWLIPKKQMKKTHDMIMNSGLTSFNYYPDSATVFNNVSIDGGVTVTNYSINHKKEDEISYYNNNEYFGIYNDETLFFSNKYEEEAYNKVFSIMEKDSNFSKYVYGNIGSLGGGEYGYNKSKHVELLKDSPNDIKSPIKIWANNGFGKGSRFDWHYIDKELLNDIPTDILKSRKIMLDKKGHSIITGKGNVINNIPKIVEKNVIASGDVLFVIPKNDIDKELLFIKQMFMTKTIRFLMTIKQKDLYVRGFEMIPDYIDLMDKLNGKEINDNNLYELFNFSEELKRHIEKHVSEKKGDEAI